MGRRRDLLFLGAAYGVMIPLTLLPMLAFAWWFGILGLVQSDVSCLLTCDRSPVGTDLQLGDGDVGREAGHVVVVGQTVGFRIHGEIAGILRPDPSVLRLIGEQQVGQAQATARYRAVGAGFADVGVSTLCGMGGCAAAFHGVRIAVSSAPPVHLTAADNGRTVTVKPGQAVEVRLDQRLAWTFWPGRGVLPIVTAKRNQVGGVYLHAGPLPQRVEATGQQPCANDGATGCSSAVATFTFTAVPAA